MANPSYNQTPWAVQNTLWHMGQNYADKNEMTRGQKRFITE